MAMGAFRAYRPLADVSSPWMDRTFAVPSVLRRLPSTPRHFLFVRPAPPLPRPGAHAPSGGRLVDVDEALMREVIPNARLPGAARRACWRRSRLFRVMGRRQRRRFRRGRCHGLPRHAAGHQAGAHRAQQRPTRSAHLGTAHPIRTNTFPRLENRGDPRRASGSAAFARNPAPAFLERRTWIRLRGLAG